MTPAIHNLTSELLAAVAHLRALHSDATVVPWGRSRARDRVFALADKLNTERAKPMSEVIAPWSDWNQRNSYKPGGLPVIFESIIRTALTPDELDVAKASVRTRDVGRIVRERYEAIHGGALRRVRDCVPTEGQTGGCSRRVAS